MGGTLPTYLRFTQSGFDIFGSYSSTRKDLRLRERPMMSAATNASTPAAHPHEPERLRLLVRLVWQCSTVAWMALAVLLIASPSFGSDAARQWVIAVSVITFGLAAIGNAWVTRGRHFGWVALTLVVALAATGLSP